MIDDVDLRIVRLDPAETRVQVRARVRSSPASDSQFTGQIVGPTCAYSTTLPTSFSLRFKPMALEDDRSAIIEWLADSTIVDPCFWEPQHPFVYAVNVRLLVNGELRDERRRIAGLCRLFSHHRRLRLNSAGWTPIGARAPAEPLGQIDAWREAGCMLWLTSVTPELATRATHIGLALAHQFAPEPTTWAADVSRLARYPSIVAWVLPDTSMNNADVDRVRELDAWRWIAKLTAAVPSDGDSLGSDRTASKSASVDGWVVTGEAPPAAHSKRPVLWLSQSLAGSRILSEYTARRAEFLADGSLNRYAGVIL